MFATSGYFRGVPCPFFASGLCERPYCHFRHVKFDEKGSEPGSLSRSHSQSGDTSLLSMVGHAIKQVQMELDQEKSRYAVATASVPSTGPVYRPSPINRQPLSTQLGPAATTSALHQAKRITIPEYKPTPIRLLKAAQKAAVGSESSEYDPTTNFAANIASSRLKRPSGTADSVQPKKAKLSDNDGDVDATFSSEDDESEQRNKSTSRPKDKDSCDNHRDSNDKTGKVVVATKAGHDVAESNKDKKTVGDKSKKNVKEKNIFDLLDTEIREDTIVKIVDKESHSDKENKSKIQETDHSGSDRNVKDTASHANITNSDYSDETQCEQTKVEHRERKKGDSSARSKDKHSNNHDRNKTDSVSSSKDTKGSSVGSSKKDKLSRSSSDKSSKHKHSADHNKSKCLDKGEVSSKSKSSVSSKHKHSVKISDSSKHKVNEKVTDTAREKDVKPKVKDKIENPDRSDQSKAGHRKERSSSSELSRSKEINLSQSKKDLQEGSKQVDRQSEKHKSERRSSSDTQGSGKSGSSEKSSSHKKLSVSKDHNSQRNSSLHTHGKDHKSSRSEKRKTDEQISSKSSSESSKHKPSKSHHHSSKAEPRSTTQSTSYKKLSDKKAIRSEKSSHKANGQHTPTKRFSAEDLFGSSDEDSDCEVLMMSPPPDHDNPTDADIIRLSSSGEEDNADLLTADFLEADEGDEDARNSSQDVRKKSVKKEKEHDIKKRTHDISEDEDSRELEQSSKKRVAHQGASHSALLKKRHSSSHSVIHRPSPAQVMQNRLLQIQKQAELAPDKQQEKGTDISPGKFFGRNRTAHAPKTSTSEGPTPCGTQDKVTPGKRQAHMPNKAVLKRPTVPADSASKVPTAVRQRYLNLFIDACLKIYDSSKDAYKRALQEEKMAAERSSSKMVYLNVAVNTVKKLRSEQGGITENGRSMKKVQSHEVTLAGPKAANTSIRRKSTVCVDPGKFTGTEMYEHLVSYILTLDELISNGFPRPILDKPGTASITYPEGRKPKVSTRASERICVRCGKRFQLDAEGNYVTEEECMYHWGRSWKRRVNGAIDTRYTCCQSDAGSLGCQVCSNHVHEQNKYENFIGYVQTQPHSPPPDGDYGVFALDCEMVYTTGGMELARVTVVRGDLKPVFEQIVKPEKPVIDYNTRFSGLTAESMEGVTTTLQDVQQALLAMFSEDTILVGHSLESDLMALKIIHSTVCDTSVVFPHRLGAPYKRGLKVLCGELLQKIIQDDDGGHDSLEDAVSAMELMLYKIKEDSRVTRRLS